MNTRRTPIASLLLLAALTAACAAGVDPAELGGSVPGDLDVIPHAPAVGHFGTVGFSALVGTTAATDVVWSAECGTITPAGLFTAPGSDVDCRVEARSTFDSTRVGTAMVAVRAGISDGWSAICAAEPLRGGTTVYVCDCASGADANCVAGADANAGTSPSSPKRTWAAAITAFNGLPAGGTVALCKGGRWAGSGQTLNNATCQPDPACDSTAERRLGCVPSTTCDLRDYTPSWASGDEGRPTIAGASTNLRIGGGNVSNGNGYRILNIALVGNGSGGDGINPTNYASDFEVCNTEINGFAHGVYNEWPNDCAIAANGGSQRHFWRGNRFLNNTYEAALVEEWNSEWDGNLFDNNAHNGGSCATSNHTWYAANNYCRVENVRFVNNEVRNNCGTNVNMASAVYSSKASSGFVIENNLIDMTPGQNGWAVGIVLETWAGCGNNGTWDGYPCGHQNATIRGNRVIMNYNGIAITMQNTPGALIENNVIVLKDGSVNGGPAIVVPRLSNSNAVESTGVTVRHNTVYLSNMTGSLVGISMGGNDAGARGQVYGNTITRASGSVSLTCLEGSATTITAYGNNHCSGGTPGYGTGWLTAAPSFTDPAAYDFTPLAGSPLVGAGSTSSSCSVLGSANQPCSPLTALDGGAVWSETATARARDAAPDIGAVER